MIDKIIRKFKTEPVRVRLYLIIATVAAYALVRGYVQPTDLDFILTMTALILGVERTRSKVSPLAKQ